LVFLGVRVGEEDAQQGLAGRGRKVRLEVPNQPAGVGVQLIAGTVDENAETRAAGAKADHEAAEPRAS
jgi:hypothetical protein